MVDLEFLGSMNYRNGGVGVQARAALIYIARPHSSALFNAGILRQLLTVPGVVVGHAAKAAMMRGVVLAGVDLADPARQRRRMRTRWAPVCGHRARLRATLGNLGIPSYHACASWRNAKSMLQRLRLVFVSLGANGRG
jgi:hypothetical protein